MVFLGILATLGSIVLSMAFFVGLWLLAVYFTSKTSGWGKLAEVYAAKARFEGQLWWVYSAYMGYTRYRNSLRIGANAQGLYLTLVAIFCVGNPALFIPWNELQLLESPEQPPRALVKLPPFVELRFARKPEVWLRIPKPVGDKILAARNWAYGDPARRQ